MLGASHLPTRASSPNPAADPSVGEVVYTARCMACHQTNGRGVPPVFPPLAGTEWVNGDKGRLIRIVLQGLGGEIEVDGALYNNVMPGWGMVMTDADIAAVLTYIRSSWGNQAGAVTAAEVGRVRAATAGRQQPWTVAEFKQPANVGVPK